MFFFSKELDNSKYHGVSSWLVGMLNSTIFSGLFIKLVSYQYFGDDESRREDNYEEEVHNTIKFLSPSSHSFPPNSFPSDISLIYYFIFWQLY